MNRMERNEMKGDKMCCEVEKKSRAWRNSQLIKEMAWNPKNLIKLYRVLYLEYQIFLDYELSSTWRKYVEEMVMAKFFNF